MGAPMRTKPTEATDTAITGRTLVVWYFLRLLPGGLRPILCHPNADRRPPYCVRSFWDDALVYSRVAYSRMICTSYVAPGELINNYAQSSAVFSESNLLHVEIKNRRKRRRQNSTTDRQISNIGYKLILMEILFLSDSVAGCVLFGSSLRCKRNS